MYPAEPIAASNASKIMLFHPLVPMLERGWPFAVGVPVFVCRITNDAASEVDLRIAVNRKAHP
jgi:hypothetical protein